MRFEDKFSFIAFQIIFFCHLEEGKWWAWLQEIREQRKGRERGIGK